MNSWIESRRWSDHQLSVLRKGYETGRPIKEIACAIGKTTHRVHSMAHTLGLRHPSGRRNGYSASLRAVESGPPTLAFVPGIEPSRSYVMRG